MNIKLFFHINNDANGLGTAELQGENFGETTAPFLHLMEQIDSVSTGDDENSRRIKNFLRENIEVGALGKIKTNIAELNKWNQKILDVTSSYLSRDISGDTDWEVKEKSKSSFEQNRIQAIGGIADEIKLAISALSGNSASVVIPGGWVGEPTGHAMLYEFKRSEDGQLYFIVHNSGDGINFHEKINVGDYKNRYAPVHIYKIPIPKTETEQDNFSGFIAELLKPRIYPEWKDSSSYTRYSKYSGERIYREVLPKACLAGGQIVSAAPFCQPGHATAGQRSGTCAYHVLNSYIKENIAEQDVAKLFIYAIKRQSIIDFFREQQTQNKLNNIDVQHQLRLAIQNASRILLKIQDKKSARGEGDVGKFPDDNFFAEELSFYNNLLQKLDRHYKIENEEAYTLSTKVNGPVITTSVVEMDKLVVEAEKTEDVVAPKHTDPMAGVDTTADASVATKKNLPPINFDQVDIAQLDAIIQRCAELEYQGKNQELIEQLEYVFLNMPLAPDKFSSIKNRQDIIKFGEKMLELSNTYKRSLNGTFTPVSQVSMLSAFITTTVVAQLEHGEIVPGSLLRIIGDKLADSVKLMLNDERMGSRSYACDLKLIQLLNYIEKNKGEKLGIADYTLDALSKAEITDDLQKLYAENASLQNYHLGAEDKFKKYQPLYAMAKASPEQLGDKRDVVDGIFQPEVIMCNLLFNLLNQEHIIELNKFKVAISNEYGSPDIEMPEHPLVKLYSPDGAKYLKSIDVPTNKVTPHHTVMRPRRTLESSQIEKSSTSLAEDKILELELSRMMNAQNCQIVNMLDFFKLNMPLLMEKKYQAFLELNTFTPQHINEEINQNADFIKNFTGFCNHGIRFYTKKDKLTPEATYFYKLQFFMRHYVMQREQKLAHGSDSSIHSATAMEQLIQELSEQIDKSNIVPEIKSELCELQALAIASLPAREQQTYRNEYLRGLVFAKLHAGVDPYSNIGFELEKYKSNISLNFAAMAPQEIKALCEQICQENGIDCGNGEQVWSYHAGKLHNQVVSIDTNSGNIFGSGKMYVKVPPMFYRNKLYTNIFGIESKFAILEEGGKVLYVAHNRAQYRIIKDSLESDNFVVQQQFVVNGETKWYEHQSLNIDIGFGLYSEQRAAPILKKVNDDALPYIIKYKTDGEIYIYGMGEDGKQKRTQLTPDEKSIYEKYNFFADKFKIITYADIPLEVVQHLRRNRLHCCRKMHGDAKKAVSVVDWLPQTITEKNNLAWAEVGAKDKDVVLIADQTRIPKYRLAGTNVTKLDVHGNEVASLLTYESNPEKFKQIYALLERFESKEFIEIWVDKADTNKVVINLPRYSLTFTGSLDSLELQTIVDDKVVRLNINADLVAKDLLVNRLNSALLLHGSDSKPVYLLPKQRFYVDDKTYKFQKEQVDISHEYYHPALDNADHVRRTMIRNRKRSEDLYLQYSATEEFITLSPQNDNPQQLIGKTAEECLYLAYVYLCGREVDKAIATLCHCKKISLSGSAKEIELISWINNLYPKFTTAQVPSDHTDLASKAELKNPEYYAAKMLALELLVDLKLRGGVFEFASPTKLDPNKDQFSDEQNYKAEQLTQVKKFCQEDELNNLLLSTFGEYLATKNNVPKRMQLAEIDEYNILNYIGHISAQPVAMSGAVKLYYHDLAARVAIRKQEQISGAEVEYLTTELKVAKKRIQFPEKYEMKVSENNYAFPIFAEALKQALAPIGNKADKFEISSEQLGLMDDVSIGKSSEHGELLRKLEFAEDKCFITSDDKCCYYSFLGKRLFMLDVSAKSMQPTRGGYSPQYVIDSVVFKDVIVPAIAKFRENIACEKVAELKVGMRDEDFFKNLVGYLELAITVDSKLTDEGREAKAKLMDFARKNIIAAFTPFAGKEYEDNYSDILIFCKIIYAINSMPEIDWKELITQQVNQAIGGRDDRYGREKKIKEFLNNLLGLVAKSDLAIEGMAQLDDIKQYKSLEPSRYQVVKKEPMTVNLPAPDSHLPWADIVKKLKLDAVSAQYTSNVATKNAAIATIKKQYSQEKPEQQNEFAMELELGKQRAELQQQQDKLAAEHFSATKASVIKTELVKQDGIIKESIDQVRIRILQLLEQTENMTLGTTLFKLAQIGEQKTKVGFSPKIPRLEFNDIFELYLAADLALYQEKTGLESDEIKKLHAEIGSFLSLSVTEQRIHRSLEAIDSGNNQALCRELLEPEDIADKENSTIMLFQYFANMLLRKEQKQYLDMLLKNTEGKFNSTYIQMIMGGGKTKVLLPILAKKKATGQNISIIMVPPALFATNVVDLNVTSDQMFSQRGVPFEFSRAKELTAKESMKIHELLTNVVITKNYLITTPESIQSLELKYLDLLYKLNKLGQSGASAEQEELKQSVLWLERSLLLLRSSGDAIVDEADFNLDPRRLLNYTIGDSGQIAAENVNAVVELYAFFDQVKLDSLGLPKTIQTMHDILQQGEAVPTDKWSDIFKKLAKELITQKSSPLSDYVAEFKVSAAEEESLAKYLLGQAKEIPRCLANAAPNIRQKFALYKGEIEVLLPLTLTRKLYENYGPSHRHNKQPEELQVAIPYASNNTPNESCKFGNQYEAVNYTVQMQYINGLDYNFFKKLVAKLQDAATEEVLDSSQPLQPANTEAAKTFKQYAGLDLFKVNVDSADSVQAMFAMLQHYKPFINYCLANHILPLLAIEPAVLGADPQTLGHSLASKQLMTGTPYNVKTAPVGVVADFSISLGTDGITINEIEQKTVDKKVVPVQQGANLSDTLRNLNMLQSTNAIIDVGGLFRGSSNLQVAKTIARHLAGNAAITHVLFYDHGVLCALAKNNPDQVITIGSSDREEIQRKLGCSPENRFTYYDQCRTIGTDILQAVDANAQVIVANDTMLKDFLQGAKRMRQLSENQTIKVACVCPAGIEMPERSITEFIQQTQQNQAERLKAINFQSSVQQLSAIVRDDLLQKIYAEADVNKKIRLFAAFEELFVKYTVDNAEQLYGQITKLEDTAGVLKSIQQDLLKRWNTSIKAAGLVANIENGIALDKKLTAVCIEMQQHCAEKVLSSKASGTDNLEVQTETQQALENQQEVEQQVELIDDALTLAPSEKRWLSAATGGEALLTGLLASGIDVKDSFILDNTITNILGFENMRDWSFSANIHATHDFLYTVIEKDSLSNPRKTVKNKLMWQDNGKLQCLLVTEDEAKTLKDYFLRSNFSGQNKNKYLWLESLAGKLQAGSKPAPELLHADYQSINEQLLLYNGNLGTIATTPNNKWLRHKLASKVMFVKNHIAKCSRLYAEPYTEFRTRFTKLQKAIEQVFGLEKLQNIGAGMHKDDLAYIHKLHAAYIEAHKHFTQDNTNDVGKLLAYDWNASFADVDAEHVHRCKREIIKAFNIKVETIALPDAALIACFAEEDLIATGNHIIGGSTDFIAVVLKHADFLGVGEQVFGALMEHGVQNGTTEPLLKLLAADKILLHRCLLGKQQLMKTLVEFKSYVSVKFITENINPDEYSEVMAAAFLTACQSGEDNIARLLAEKLEFSEPQYIHSASSNVWNYNLRYHQEVTNSLLEPLKIACAKNLTSTIEAIIAKLQVINWQGGLDGEIENIIQTTEMSAAAKQSLTSVVNGFPEFEALRNEYKKTAGSETKTYNAYSESLADMIEGHRKSYTKEGIEYGLVYLVHDVAGAKDPGAYKKILAYLNKHKIKLEAGAIVNLKADPEDMREYIATCVDVGNRNAYLLELLPMLFASNPEPTQVIVELINSLDVEAVGSLLQANPDSKMVKFLFENNKDKLSNFDVSVLLDNSLPVPPELYDKCYFALNDNKHLQQLMKTVPPDIIIGMLSRWNGAAECLLEIDKELMEILSNDGGVKILTKVFELPYGEEPLFINSTLEKAIPKLVTQDDGVKLLGLMLQTIENKLKPNNPLKFKVDEESCIQILRQENGAAVLTKILQLEADCKLERTDSFVVSKESILDDKVSEIILDDKNVGKIRLPYFDNDFFNKILAKENGIKLLDRVVELMLNGKIFNVLELDDKKLQMIVSKPGGDELLKKISFKWEQKCYWVDGDECNKVIRDHESKQQLLETRPAVQFSATRPSPEQADKATPTPSNSSPKLPL